MQLSMSKFPLQTLLNSITFDVSPIVIAKIIECIIKRLGLGPLMWMGMEMGSGNQVPEDDSLISSNPEGVL